MERELNTSDAEILDNYKKEVGEYNVYHREIEHEDRNPRVRRNWCGCWRKV